MEFMTKLFDTGQGNVSTHPEDAGDGTTGVQSKYLKFGPKQVMISDEEEAALNAALATYVNEFGLSHGFAAWLCEGRG
jgi:hypothetical protein